MVTFLKKASGLVIVSMVSVKAFQNGPISRGSIAVGSVRRGTTAIHLSSLTPPENEAAKAMTAYLAKVHEERLQTLQIIIEKDAEIEHLKCQLEEKNTLVVSQSSSPEEEQMKTQLAAYQKFIADYIVKAQEDKARAVKAAEMALKKRYEEKLRLLLGADQSQPPATSLLPVSKESITETFSTLQQPTLYEKRSQMVKAQGDLSRWSASEVQKITNRQEIGSHVDSSLTTQLFASNINPSSLLSVPIINSITPELIKTADHGLRNEGSLSLETRLTQQGINGEVVPSKNYYFVKRCQKVKAEGDLSRWGQAEVQKLLSGGMIGSYTKNAYSYPSRIQLTSNIGAALFNGEVLKNITPELIQEADHGLRREGSISLEERLTKGAPREAAPAGSNFFVKRSEKVKVEGERSRWGQAEIQKVLSGGMIGSYMKPLESLAKTQLTANIGSALLNGELVKNITPELIQQADHGLHRQGSLSLEERLTKGASREAAPAGSNYFVKRSGRVMNDGDSSRWAGAEVNKISNKEVIGSYVKPASVISTGPRTANIGAALLNGELVKNITPELIRQADHGLHREGSLSLEQRLTKGVDAAAAFKPSVPVLSLYAKRNSRVIASAEAGKCRWGTAELRKVQRMVADQSHAPTSDPPPRPFVKLSLEQRLNLGARALALSSQSPDPAQSLALSNRVNLGVNKSDLRVPYSSSSLYMARNQRVLESDLAGKSRWGDKEIQTILQANNNQDNNNNSISWQ